MNNETEVANKACRGDSLGHSPTPLPTTHPNFAADVAELMGVFGQVVKRVPELADDATRELRIRLIEEEVNELLGALKTGDLVGIADGGVDSIVVILGALLAYGIPVNPVWVEIHRSNMNKIGGPKDAYGKQLKPPSWRPPDVAGELAKVKVNKGLAGLETSHTREVLKPSSQQPAITPPARPDELFGRLTMKAITIHQPYATLIAIGLKRFETRGWPTRYQGPIAIHAGKKWDDEVAEECKAAMEYIEEIKYVVPDVATPLALLPWQQTLGSVLAVANLASCREMFEAPNPHDARWGWFGLGRYGWEMSAVLPLLKPVPWRGQQGLWDVPPELEAMIRGAMADAAGVAKEIHA